MKRVRNRLKKRGLARVSWRKRVRKSLKKKGMNGRQEEQSVYKKVTGGDELIQKDLDELPGASKVGVSGRAYLPGAEILSPTNDHYIIFL